MGGDFYAPALQNLAADRPGEHQRRRQTPGKMAAAPDVVSALIADVSGIIGVARPGQHRQIAVIPRTDVAVADHRCQRSAGQGTVSYAGQNFRQIFLLAGSGG